MIKVKSRCISGIAILAFCSLTIATLNRPVHAGEFAMALPGYDFQFPRDHGAHHAYRSEWWYYTGNLNAEDGAAFGFELTIFRLATLPPGSPEAAASPLVADQVYLGHFAISDVDGRRHTFWERLGRPGLGEASASTRTLDVRVGAWSIRMEPDQTMRLAASAPIEDEETSPAALALTLKPLKPLVVHGRNGVHQKAEAPGQASHYISFTRLASEGTLSWRGRKFAVRGLSWMDHEFGSDQLSPDEIGWDWFALQLDSGEDLMLYQLRRRDGSVNPHSTGSLVAPDGTLTVLDGDQYRITPTGQWKSPATGATYPMGWTIALPGEQGKLTVSPAMEDQEMRTERTAGTAYWEGAVRVGGTWRGRPVRGRGYTELVGYAGEMRGLSAKGSK